MSLTIEHRSDQLLQKKNAEPIDERLANTYVGKYTTPIHKALEAFLDEKLVGKTFESKSDIEAVLIEWPAFLCKHSGITERHIIREWDLYISNQGTINADTGGMGGDFWAADIIQSEAAAVQTA